MGSDPGDPFVRHPRHSTTRVMDARTGNAWEIDNDLVELIKQCWRLGIDTSECCQEAHPGIATVTFLTPNDLGRFFRALSYEKSEEHYWNRATQLLEYGGWVWRLWASPELMGSADFPRAQIEWVVGRLRGRPDDWVEMADYY